jgi:N-acetylglucosaminyldiphosphoundecaprenol N-acetyl-beta-D-mannosaminyltransferase
MPLSSSDRIIRDLQRDVHCLFGLPVDNLTMAQTKALLRERCKQEGNTVLATINVNWVAQSLREPAFREAIINSDLVVLDGKPLLWLARLFGCPMRQTVPGSTLIQELLEVPSDHPLTIFLFGGEGDAAEQAMQRINERKDGGLRAVGAVNPGFGTVEAMSSDTIIATINNTKPDILLVALGAKKGTQWIEQNRHRLNAKIISHLGATINFLAGTVKRAPKIFRTLGLEWVWRIVQEPKLFSRYAKDGFVLLKVLLSRILLWLRYRVWQLRFSRELADNAGKLHESEHAATLIFEHHPWAAQDTSLRDLFHQAVLTDKDLILDFQATKYVSSAFLGLLLILEKHLLRNGKKLFFRDLHGKPAKVARLFCVRNASVGES